MIKKTIKKSLYAFVGIFILLNIITIFHAYKLTYFYDNAILTKPEEMTGWQKTRAILFGVEYPKKKSVDTFSIPHKTITLTTKDGETLEAWHVNQPTSNLKNKGTTIILFHGHGGNKNGVITEATSFYKMGYNILLVDFRAHGNSSGNACTIGANEANDVLAAYNFSIQQNQKVILYGISMGAAAILKAMNDYSLKPLKIIIEMPFGTLQEAVKGRLRIMHLPQQPFASLLTFWGGTLHGFWAFNFKPQEYAKAIQCPTLIQWGLQDIRVSKKETETIYKNLAYTEKKLVVYENTGHKSLLQNEPIKWKNNVTAFLQ